MRAKSCSQPAAPQRFSIGHPGYGTAQLCQDLDRFVFVLAGNDGEPLFGP
jgi:hypothetical protein